MSAEWLEQFGERVSSNRQEYANPFEKVRSDLELVRWLTNHPANAAPSDDDDLELMGIETGVEIAEEQYNEGHYANAIRERCDAAMRLVVYADQIGDAKAFVAEKQTSAEAPRSLASRVKPENRPKECLAT